MSAIVRVRNLRKTFGHFTALDGIDLDVIAKLIRAGMKDLKKKYETDY